MKNKLWLHNGKKISGVFSPYYLAITPLIIYGVYKNGWMVLNNGFGTKADVYKIIILMVSTILFSLVFRVGILLLKHQSISWTRVLGDDLLLINLLLVMMLPININLLIILPIILFNSLIKYLLAKFRLSINPVALSKLLFVGVLLYFGKYTYANLYEANTALNYPFTDILFGKNITGMAISNSFIVIMAYIVFTTTKYYKKNIPFYALVSLIIPLVLYCSIYGSIDMWCSSIKFLVSNGILFNLVFIAPLSLYSPISQNKQKVFGAFIGLLIFIFFLLGVNNQEIAPLAILILSFLFTFKA